MKLYYRLSQLIIRDQFIKILLALIFLMMVLVVIAGCTQQDNSNSSGPDLSTIEFKTAEVQPDLQMPAHTKTAREAVDCPALDSQLKQLVQMEDPATSAAALGLKVKEDKVQVLITLMDEDVAFLSDFNAEVGTQSGNQVQAYVPFDQLCPLANIESVISVRPSAQAIPLS